MLQSHLVRIHPNLVPLEQNKKELLASGASCVARHLVRPKQSKKKELLSLPQICKASRMKTPSMAGTSAQGKLWNLLPFFLVQLKRINNININIQRWMNMMNMNGFDPMEMAKQ